ncbi:unnamed protein product [Fasciola hepatica]|uniref:SCP domain-containing protein n=1 Tax=Fasciola hepatica TaxID=6192 RepID=A0ABC9HFP9_FASHE
MDISARIFFEVFPLGMHSKNGPTKIVWAKSEAKGCGYQNCENIPDVSLTIIIVCNYGPAGNLEGERPYEEETMDQRTLPETTTTTTETTKESVAPTITVPGTANSPRLQSSVWLQMSAALTYWFTISHGVL